jgi:transposase
MQKIKEILRLRYEVRLSYRGIHQALNIGYGTVVDYLQRAKVAGVEWPLPETMDERTLGRLLFPSSGASGQQVFIDLDYLAVHQELKRPHVTKLLLWEEYRQQHPVGGYSYAQFCARYKAWQDRQVRSMRQHHKAGETLFVDYCGPTVAIVNPDTGEIKRSCIFVAVLGASNYTYAEATWSQGQADWINSHARTFAFLDGVPQIVVPDNLKSAVIKPHRHEPRLNPAYQQMANHYQVGIVPARPYKPKDKAKAEGAVLIVERWILARLRHQTFFTLAALNQAISLLLEDLNNRPFKKLPGTRRSQFEQLDRPHLRDLPVNAYTYVDIKQAGVHIDYHIEYDKHYYSVPHALVKQRVEVHAADHSLVIYSHGERVASHPRSYRKGGHTTCADHMPAQHRAMHGWSTERFQGWANDIGPQTRAVVDQMLGQRRYIEQNYRAVLGLLGLAKNYTPQRLDDACGRALLINSPTRTSVASILKNGLDQQPLANDAMKQESLALEEHENIRGEAYYH